MFIKFKCSLTSLPIGLYFKESFLNKEAGRSVSKYLNIAGWKTGNWKKNAFWTSKKDI